MGDEWVNSGASKALALDLILLGDLCSRWTTAWNGFPDRLLSLKEYFEHAQKIQDDTSARVAAAESALRGLINLGVSGALHPSDVPLFTSKLSQIILDEKSKPGYREPGSLYSHLHGKLENVLNFLSHGPTDITSRAIRCLDQIGAAPSNQQGELRLILERARDASQALDTKQLSESSLNLQSYVSKIPQGAFRKSHIKLDHRAWRHWIIVGVEDDPVWQETLRKAVDLVRAQLQPDYEVMFELFADRESAQKRLQQLVKRTVGGDLRAGDEQRPLAVLDMGIPSGPGDVEAPSRDVGIELLRFARSPTVNVPVVVLTTAPDFLGDHLTAAECGVSNYLLKGTDSVERLVEVLTELITSRPRHKVRVLEETGRIVMIDDVEVPLEPQIFKTFSVFVDQHPSAVTAEYAVSLLEEKFGGYRNMPGHQPDMYASNISRNWAAARQHSSRATEAVTWFQHNLYTLWKELIVELRGQGIGIDDPEVIAQYLDRTYGANSTDATEFDPENIEKHIYEARTAIKRSFNAVQRTISPEEEVIANTIKDDEFAYKIVADVIFDVQAEDEKPSRQFRILVGENDVQGWQAPVTNLLRRFGYEVQAASSVREAISIAEHFRPDLLCLDMHLPKDAASFEHDPMGGDPRGGVQILQAISQFLPGIRAIAFTDLADSDELRVKAAELGVRVTDFISKSSPPDRPWDAQLIFRIHRIEQEINREAHLPLPSMPRLPYIRLRRSLMSNRQVEVFGEPWKLTNNQFKMLWLLAERANRPVPTWLLMEELYGNLNAQEALKQLIKNFRKLIQERCKSWFGISDAKNAKDVAQFILANDAKAGYVLNARVVIED
jgi:CheY-like chemotaxis protein